MEAAASGRSPGDAALEVLRANAALMREQIGLARNERFRNRIKAVRDIALAAAVLAIVGGAGAVLWNAHRASGLVVEAFQTPPAMAATGLDGSVLAARLLDRLSAMQAGTDSSRAPATFSNNWGNDLAVEVPQTGMSAGEVWRMLRQTLGHETRLSGDLTETEGRLTLTTRVGANPGVSVTGDADALDALLDEAARAVYRQAQPYRYSVWLNRNGRGGDAEILAELASSSDRTEQLWSLVGQSVNALPGQPEQSLALAREALTLDPTFHKARWNFSDALLVMGRQEEDLHQLRLIERAMRRRDRRVTESAQNQVLHSARGSTADYLGDFATMVDERRVQAGLPDYAGNALLARYDVVRGLIALHDGAAARAALSSARRTAQSLPDMADYTAALEADARGDAGAAAGFARSALAAAENIVGLPQIQVDLALILMRGGDRAGAEALLSAMPADCYPCVIGRGRMAALNGDGVAAERLLAHATRLGPSLPAAWQALGRARLDRGDRTGALRAFEEASKRGPRWADPLKYWGDVLAANGDAAGAIRKYRAAERLAPNWGALHLAWGRALDAGGQRAEAVERYRRAATLDLITTDKAAVAARLARP